MQRRRDVGIDFSKKRITNSNMLKQLIKYLSSQKFLYSDVKSLIYTYNSLTNICSFSDFENLQSLDLSHNRFDCIPENITFVSQLKTLNMSHNKIQTTPAILSKLSTLTCLDLSYNQIKTFDFERLYPCTTLKTLKIQANEIVEFDYNDIKPMKQLQEFSVNGNFIENPKNADGVMAFSFASPYYQCVPNQIEEHLFLGSLDSTKDRDILLNRNIIGVLSLGVKAIVVSKKIRVEYMPIPDLPTEAIDILFPQCFNFIDSIIKSGGNVLIHCQAGISRSSTVLIAYIMHRNGWTYRESFDYIRKKRPIIMPNAGFERQLLTLEQRMFNAMSETETEQEE
ncbi:protein-tyrosine-phosphatase [Entamoeba marina]